MNSNLHETSDSLTNKILKYKSLNEIQTPQAAQAMLPKFNNFLSGNNNLNSNIPKVSSLQAISNKSIFLKKNQNEHKKIFFL